MASTEDLVIHELNGDFFTTLGLTRGPVLGDGMSGEVVLTTFKDHPSEKKAVKIFSLLTPDGGVRSHRLFNTEVRALQGLRHPYIIKYFGSVRCPEHLIICTGYCPNGTLTSKLDNLSFGLCNKYFFQLASAVRYLNIQQRMVHNDIKPDNIFIDANNDAVLGDFGLAFAIPPSSTVVSTAGMGGTLHFNAIEKEVWSYVDPLKLDVYSLGVVLMCMLFNRLLTTDTMYDILKDKQLLMAIPNPLGLCVLSMIQPFPCHRWTMAQILREVRKMGYSTSPSDAT
ncbi:unnamed protein product [Candidula unifasciata]|uniref:non-specific serine/threonine protein kinase n=1 Tax=Candidula unifasciata TaxID=100452 RepID=A0A8S3ZKC5_9EUPU|nr:unnamed protein product [Candidula unifasciata]